jgi:release factor glutamine methyltransferase
LSLAELLAELVGALAHEHEALIILEEVTGLTRSELRLRSADEVPPEALARARELTRRRVGGEPLQHVIGHWSFRHLELVQDRRALVVRPETEVVVGEALRALGALSSKVERPVRVLDLGTGSGAIALSIASELDRAEVVAVDRSLAALELARTNRDALADELRPRVRLLASDWYGALSAAARFDLIISNPPYLASTELAELDPEVRGFDPHDALVAGMTGLEAHEEILSGAAAHLCEGGLLVLEIGATQGEAARRLAIGHGAVGVEVRQDLAARDRVLLARFPGAHRPR